MHNNEGKARGYVPPLTLLMNALERRLVYSYHKDYSFENIQRYNDISLYSRILTQSD